MWRVEEPGAVAAAIVAWLLILGMAAALGAALAAGRRPAARRDRTAGLAALAGPIGAAIVLAIDAGSGRAVMFAVAGVGLAAFGHLRRPGDAAPVFGALVIGLFVGGAEYGAAIALTALGICVRWFAEPRRRLTP